MAPTQTTSRIILASPEAGGHTAGALLTAAVLADWFSVPLTMVTDTADRCASLETLAQTLGTETETTLCFESSFGEQLMAFAHDEGPSIVVGDPTNVVLDIASRSTQPTLLVGTGRGPRLSTGPLVLDGPTGASDLETLALVAAWSAALEQPVQIVEEIGTVNHAEVEADRRRLREMGIDVGVDRVNAQGDGSAVLVCQTRRALALVVPNRRLLDDGLIQRALDSGVNVLVAASPDPVHAEHRALNQKVPDPTPVLRPAQRRIERLDPIECMTYLRSRRVGRLGYVDAGWPIVLPINFRVSDDGDIVFKSIVGGKTAAAARSTFACFEVDDIDGVDRPIWSVVVQGELSVARNPHDLTNAWRNDPEPWIDGDEWLWLRLTPLTVSGRRIVVADEA